MPATCHGCLLLGKCVPTTCHQLVMVAHCWTNVCQRHAIDLQWLPIAGSWYANDKPLTCHGCPLLGNCGPTTCHRLLYILAVGAYAMRMQMDFNFVSCAFFLQLSSSYQQLWRGNFGVKKCEPASFIPNLGVSLIIVYI